VPGLPAASAPSQAEQAPTFTNPNDFQAAISDLGTPTVVDFEDIDASPVINTFVGRDPFNGNIYAGKGILFSNPDGIPLFIAPEGASDRDGNIWNASNSLSVEQFPFDLNAEGTPDDRLLVTLEPPAVAIGFTIVDLQGGSGLAQFIDSEGNTVRQIDVSAEYASNRAFVGSVSVERPIAMVKFANGPNTGDVTYDDFIFVPASAVSTLTPQAEQARAFAEPILQAIADRPPDFEDDFSTADKGWRWEEPSGSSVAIKDGVLSMNTTRPYPSLWAKHELFTVPDFALQLEFRPKTVLQDAGVGFGFRDTNGPGYGLEFYPDYSTWGAWCVACGGNVELGKGNADVVKMGVWTKLLIVAKGTEFAIYLNDKPFTYFSDDTLPRGLIKIGMNSRGHDTVVEFDNVKFWNLENVPGLP